jgi:predicted  nucleic acid-binding Zn-ribbon protein
MSVETFQNLIEIQSLLDRKSKHFATIEEEKLRLAHIDKVNDRKTIELNDATDELQTLKHELASGEKRISEINALLEKMKEDFYTLKSEKEMETFKVREKSLQ